MAKPRIGAAITWPRYEKAVLAVFTQALREFAAFKHLPAAEEPINLNLYWLALKAHQEQLNSPEGSMPFTIDPDSTNKPEPDDSARSKRMKKRPDFCCTLKNAQATDFRKSQVNYYLECKRLGRAVGTWVLNENYSEHGIARFAHADWQYGKGCTSAAMIGYMQDQPPDDILTDVNSFATPRSIPSLSCAAKAWVNGDVTKVSQGPLTRAFHASTIQLNHLWTDLRQCTFDVPSDAPPAAASPPPKKNRKKRKMPVKAVAKTVAKKPTAGKARKPKQSP